METYQLNVGRVSIIPSVHSNHAKVLNIADEKEKNNSIAKTHTRVGFIENEERMQVANTPTVMGKRRVAEFVEDGWKQSIEQLPQNTIHSQVESPKKNPPKTPKYLGKAKEDRDDLLKYPLYCAHCAGEIGVDGYISHK